MLRSIDARAGALCLALCALNALAEAQRPAPEQILAARSLRAGTIDTPTLRWNAAGTHPVQLTVRLAGQQHDLVLEPLELRAPGYETWIGDGVHLAPIPLAEPRTYQGSVIGVERSAIAGGRTRQDEFRFLIALEDALWAIEPISEDTGIPGEYLYYEASDHLPLPFSCAPPLHGGGPATPVGETSDIPPLQQSPLVADVAIEADLEFFQLHASDPQRTVDDIFAVMAMVDMIYKRDTGIGYAIPHVVISTVSYGTSDPSTLLSNMRSRWDAGTYSTIPRDVAHLFTGVNMNGNTIGIAYLNGVCVRSTQYGLSESLFATSLSARAALTAHQLGHNWNANNCSGNDCHIMCPTLGGCSGLIDRFGSASKAAIISSRDAKRGCLWAPGAGANSDGGDVTFANLDSNPRPEMILMTYDDPSGANAFFYAIGWNIDRDGFTAQWTSHSSPGLGHFADGAGMAIVDVDGNSVPDLLLMAYDIGSPSDEFRFKVLLNLDSHGVPQGNGTYAAETPGRTVPGLGNEGDGAGVAIAFLDANPLPDALFLAYDDPSGANDFVYRVAYNLDGNANWTGLSGAFRSGGLGNDAEGAGICVGQFNRNPAPDALVTCYDIGNPANEIRYKYLYDLRPNGSYSSESGALTAGSHGFSGAGAGVAVVDLHNDGRCDAVFAVVDDGAVNHFRWSIVHNACICPGEIETFGSSCPGPMTHAASGTAHLGGSVVFDLANGPRLSSAYFVLGASRTSYRGLLSLPLDLRVVGAPGCFLYTDELAFTSTLTSFLGRASYTMNIPNDPSFACAEVFAQYYVLDPGRNFLNLAFSNAVRVRIGS